MENEKKKLPCYRGEMLLLKYLELRVTTPPPLSTIANDFVQFVEPLDGVLPRPPERVYRYLNELKARKFARVVNSDRSKTPTVEITEVGLLNSQGIGLDPVLRAQWEKQT